MSNPNEELLKALDKLEAFTQENLKNPTRFEEVKDILQTLFFSEYRKEKQTKEQTVKKELFKSIGLVKTYLPLIDKYRQGSPEEQRFAETITQTIDRYNKAVTSRPKAEESEERLTIEPYTKIAYKKMESSAGKKIEALFKNKRAPETPPSQQELDTLKMKAIRLIESDSTFQEALLETIKGRGTGSSEEIAVDGNTVTLMQTWSELPGEIHRIVGAFKRESKHSIPIKDSFNVYLESTQSGHPFSSQHMGWALSHWLVPSTVLWMEQIPLLRPIIDRKKKTAQDLLPKGKKNIRARKIYRLKKIIFEESKLEFLTFHQELAHAICRASPEQDEDGYKFINRFYEELAQHNNAFEALAHTNDEINRIFVEVPFEKIEEMRLSGSNDELFNAYEHERHYLENLYVDTAPEKTPFEKVRKEYIHFMGCLQGNAAFLLLKLQLSEKLFQKPPPISDFELKIQACAYKHQLEFLDELDETSNLDDLNEKAALKIRMRMEIQSEIELFATPYFEDIDPFLQELTEETVSYFHARFHSHE